MSSTEPEAYTTVAQSVRVRLPIGLCRFFASVREVATEEEARAFIDEIKAEFADATHNAWAYRLGYGENTISRSNDDGEPANTAGPPMLQAIEGRDLTNLVVVGTRYFGGVKLGVGGLIRAYRDTAQAGLEAAGLRQEIILIDISIKHVDYAAIGAILREIEGCGSIVKIDYGQEVTIFASIRPHALSSLGTRITDITRGQAILEVAP